MYIHKQNRDNLLVPNRNTRGAVRDKFYIERYQNCKYKNSPYYKGAELWKNLPIDLTRSECLFQFKTGLKKLYKKYKCDD